MHRFYFSVFPTLFLALLFSACSKTITGYIQSKERSSQPIDPALDTLVRSTYAGKSGKIKLQTYSLNNRQLFVRQYRYQKDGRYWVAVRQGHFSKDTGERYLCYPDGSISGRVPLLNGQAEGLARFYHPDGGLSEETTFKADLRHGRMRLYWNTGQLYAELEYSEGRLMAVHNFFGPFGTPLKKGSFENGNGEVWWYNNTATKVAKIEVYQSGKRIKTKRAGSAR